MPTTNITLLSQVLRLIPRSLVAEQVNKHNSDKHAKGYGTWSQLVSMLLCHLGDLASVRDIANGLRIATGDLSHLGIQTAPSKSSISYQNKHRGAAVFERLYAALLDKYEPSLQKRKLSLRKLKRKIFALDSTVIPLTLSVFDWAHFRRKKGGVKLHTVLDLDSGLPTFINITKAKKHDSKGALNAQLPKGSVLVMDRAYLDFRYLNDLDSNEVYFVTRVKSNTQYYEVGTPAATTNELGEFDKRVSLTNESSRVKYSGQLRVVRVWDPVNECHLDLLTNNMKWATSTIGELYRARWDIEQFFRTIKQTLRIKTFVGTSQNAVLVQIWTAMIAILLIKYLKSRTKFPWHVSNLVSLIRLNLFVKTPLWTWLNNPIATPKNRSIKEHTLFSG